MITDSQPPAAAFPPLSPTGVAVLLRETRLKLGRDIAVAANVLRIRQPYLQAIEDGRFQDLPGSTYAVGFVRGYAEYLGLDGNEIVRRFKQENSDLAGRAELVFPTTASGSGIPTGALLGIAIVGAAIAYGLWYWLQDREDVAAEAVPPLPERLAALIHRPVGDGSDVVPVQDTPRSVETLPLTAASSPPPAAISDSPPAVAEEPPPAPPAAALPPLEAAKPVKVVKPAPVTPIVTPPSPTPVVAAAADGDNPSAAGTAPPAEPPKPKVVWHNSKRIVLRAEDTCWVKIRDAQGQIVLSRLLHKGDQFAPPDAAGLDMTVGSAAALTVLVDGKELPSLGPAGQVKHLSLDIDKLDKSAPREGPTATEPQ